MLRNKIAALVLCVLALIAMAGASGCERTITLLQPDTVVTIVHDTLPTKVDTLTLTRVDTVTHYDTTWQRDTVPGPPVHDTTVVVKVDTVTQVDTVVKTVILPGTVVHDTTWVYTQTDPTNPLAGGDTLADVAFVQAYGMYIVFWHGHFVGVVAPNNNGTWRAYLYVRQQLEMPLRGDYPTLPEAVLALVPVVVTVQERTPKHSGGL